MPSARVKKLEHFTILYKWTINGAPHSFSRKVTAKSILTNMRLNDEPSDPTVSGVPATGCSALARQWLI